VGFPLKTQFALPVFSFHKQLEALGQCKPMPRHVLPVPPSGESIRMNVR